MLCGQDDGESAGSGADVEFILKRGLGQVRVFFSRFELGSVKTLHPTRTRPAAISSALRPDQRGQ
jgi:hypothetical protein